MCGINFFLSSRNLEESLKEAALKTSHRGPDHLGISVQNESEKYIGLAHNRLSIIDLSSDANQPFRDDECDLIFNGEVYNYIELREGLIEKGVSFRTDSDTEVILKLYLNEGQSAFDKLEGMFAFVLYDSKNKSVFLVRDRMGIKPLYFSNNDSDFFASSELKSLFAMMPNKPKVSAQSVYDFFNVGFLYEPATGFENTYKVLPGTYLKIDFHGKVENFNYKDREAFLDKQYSSPSSLLKQFKKSIERQEISDVPVGIFFSGGNDSSLIAGLSRTKNYLFIDDSDESFPNQKNDELIASRKISKIFKGNLDVVQAKSKGKTPDELMEQIDFVARHTEELISDFTFYSSYTLSEIARENGYKVMLSGMGGDEVFVGYPRYRVLRFWPLLRKIRFIFKVIYKLRIYPRSFGNKIERLLSFCYADSWIEGYNNLIGYFSKKELNSLLTIKGFSHNEFESRVESLLENFSSDCPVKKAQHLDKFGFLSHNLAVADKSSMLSSIELRVPLLDDGLVSLSSITPTKKHINFSVDKLMIKNALSTLLPKKLVYRKKVGFNPPLEELVQSLGKERVLLELKSLEDVLDSKLTTQIVREHFSGKKQSAYKIWQLLYFSRWFKNHGDVGFS